MNKIIIHRPKNKKSTKNNDFSQVVVLWERDLQPFTHNTTTNHTYKKAGYNLPGFFLYQNYLFINVAMTIEPHWVCLGGSTIAPAQTRPCSPALPSVWEPLHSSDERCCTIDQVLLEQEMSLSCAKPLQKPNDASKPNDNCEGSFHVILLTCPGAELDQGPCWMPGPSGGSPLAPVCCVAQCPGSSRQQRTRLR